MKVVVTLTGSVLLCASMIGEAGTLKPPVNPALWLAFVPNLGHLVPFASVPEPAWLLLLGVGFVFLAHPTRRKRW